MDEKKRAERREQRHSQTFAEFTKYLRRVGSISEEMAERASVAVLCALERRILPDEAKDLESQLPFKLRELVRRCDTHAGVRPHSSTARSSWRWSPRSSPCHRIAPST